MVNALGRVRTSTVKTDLSGPGRRCLHEPGGLGWLPSWAVVAVAVGLAILPLGSCNRHAAASPPAPEPRLSRVPKAPQPTSEPVSEPQTVATLPRSQPVPPEAVPETPGPLASQPEEEASRTPEPSPARPATNTPPVTTEASVQPEAPAAPVPQLGQILSPDQRREFNQTIDVAIRRAQERLDVVLANSARLNDEQHATIKRIRAFLRQAQEAREQDLMIAKSLADRARVLAEDLAKNFK